jgi:perosamine synthetase
MIPVNEPYLGGRELEYLTDCLQTGWISSEGRYIEAFEQAWAAYCGVAHGVAVSNGTVALQLAVAMLDLQPGDEVIVPTFTIISCAQAVTYNGGTVVLVDSDPQTWCMDVDQLAAKITPRTRAIMPVHLYGHPVDMDPVRALAQRHNLVIVEDAAEAHGATYKGARCGGLGDLGCFSFYANKIITTGEGGMVVTNSAAYAERLRWAQPGLSQRPPVLSHRVGAQLSAHQPASRAGAGRSLSALRRRWRTSAGWARPTPPNSAAAPNCTAVQAAWATNVYWMYGLVLDERYGVPAVEFSRRLAAHG